MAPQLLMVTRAGRPEHTPEAEPALIDTDGSALVLTLDDGETISLSTEEVVAYLRDSGLLDHVRLVA